MAHGDTTRLAPGSYKCASGETCAYTKSGIPTAMIMSQGRSGTVECSSGDANECVLDGDNEWDANVVIWSAYTTGSDSGPYNSGTLTIRALTFQNADNGALYFSGTAANIELCRFVDNRKHNDEGDAYGGAIGVRDWTSADVNLYAVSFVNNESDSGNDIGTAGGAITVHNTCPSPFSSMTPIQGQTALDTFGAVGGSLYSYSGCSTSSPTASPTVSPTAIPTAAPTASPTISHTASPTAGPTASPTSYCLTYCIAYCIAYGIAYCIAYCISYCISYDIAYGKPCRHFGTLCSAYFFSIDAITNACAGAYVYTYDN